MPSSKTALCVVISATTAACRPSHLLALLYSAKVDELLASSSGRFALASDYEIAKLAVGLVPQNITKMTTRALKNFHEWKTNRNHHQCIWHCVDRD